MAKAHPQPHDRGAADNEYPDSVPHLRQGGLREWGLQSKGASFIIEMNCNDIFISLCDVYPMLPTLDLDLLRTFIAVAETRHFTRASERLNCVQSAVSMQIKRLETTLDTRLFERSRRHVKLTGEGEVLLGYARRMLRMNEEALASIGRPSVHGRVRLGATDNSMPFLPDVLPGFARDYPLVEVELGCVRSWEALDLLEEGDVDLALVTQGCGRDGGLTVHAEPLVWAVSQGSLAQDLDPVPLAIFAPGCIYREAALMALEASGRSWRHAYSSPSRNGLDAACEAGLAVTILPASRVGPKLKILDDDSGFPALPEFEMILFQAADEIPPPARALAEVIVGAFEPRKQPQSAAARHFD
ncbi:MAG: LysR substrate-binding domain-containing protein [Methyloligellaceae bacterium]